MEIVMAAVYVVNGWCDVLWTWELVRVHGRRMSVTWMSVIECTSATGRSRNGGWCHRRIRNRSGRIKRRHFSIFTWAVAVSACGELRGVNAGVTTHVRLNTKSATTAIMGADERWHRISVIRQARIKVYTYVWPLYECSNGSFERREWRSVKDREIGGPWDCWVGWNLSRSSCTHIWLEVTARLFLHEESHGDRCV